MANILLLEPNYKNKYPPIGLMKIATYHKMLGDNVQFYKGDLRTFLVKIKTESCIKSLFRINNRIDWNKRIENIKAYISLKQNKYLEAILEDIDNETSQRAVSRLKFYSRNTPKNKWDKIYITTLFTFYWDITIKTIEFGKSLVDDINKVYVGGVMASLLKDEIYNETGVLPFTGLLDKPGMLDGGNNIIIDELPLDYSILEEVEYKYPTRSAYFTFMTKGCTRKCAFCSVPKLEPTYKEKVDSLDKFSVVKEQFGEQRNLLLMDNNVLASPKFPDIIEEIKQMGFYKGSMYTEPNQLRIALNNLKAGQNDVVYRRIVFELLMGLRIKLKGEDLHHYEKVLIANKILTIENVKKRNLIKASAQLDELYEQNRLKNNLVRYVDFNQGVDARYINEANMKLMAQIPIKPLRIAFDHIGIKKIYIKAVELAAQNGIDNLSNYILYNFHDKPEDFYERLKINVDLGKRLNIKIFSFPMKYIPLFGEEAKHRKYIGPNWNRKFIRAIQCILNATKGIVAPGYEFFYMAFGKNLSEFSELLWMPEAYIINRNFFKGNGMVENWREDFNALDADELRIAKEIIMESDFTKIESYIGNMKIGRLLSHYSIAKGDKEFIGHEVRKVRAKFNKLIKKDSFIELTLTHDFDQSKRTKLNIS